MQPGPSNPPVAQPRIALVAGSVGFGGATIFLCNFAGELFRRNIPAHVFSLADDHALESDFRRLKIPVTCFDSRKTIFEDCLARLLQSLRSFQPTAVISTLGAVSFETLRYVPPGVFRVGLAQSDDPNVYQMIRPYATHMDMMAVVSREMKQKTEALGEFAKVPVAYLPYGVPVPTDNEMPARDFNQPLRIIYVGRVAREQKRVHLFPEIFSRLKSSGMPFHWTIAGDGPEMAWLKDALKDTNPNQTVSFAGLIPYGAITGALLAHDVFLLASDYEGLPISLLEAMSCGLVPVVSDLPSGIPEVVNETTGFRIALNNVASYAEAIVRLHQNRQDLSRLSRNARDKVVREFSVAAMADRWLNIFPKSAPPIAWPQSWNVQRILGAKPDWRFSPMGRALRRIKYRLRG